MCAKSLCDPMDYSPPGSSVHQNSPGKNIEMGCHALLQGIFLTQGLNPCLLHLLQWQMTSLPRCRLGGPISPYTFFHFNSTVAVISFSFYLCLVYISLSRIYQRTGNMSLVHQRQAEFLFTNNTRH